MYAYFFSHFILFYFVFVIRVIFSIFHIWITHFLDSEQYVGKGIDTLMSISDGLSPSIFCRKMEKARPTREEIDGKVVFFPPDSAFFNSDAIP